jgi:hypothetical protein
MSPMALTASRSAFSSGSVPFAACSSIARAIVSTTTGGTSPGLGSSDTKPHKAPATV